MTDQAIRVLLADDHEMVLDIFAMFLNHRAEMEIETAKTLDEAMEVLIEKGPFDAVLLDLNMPGMNGIEVLKRLREWSDAPVLILSVRDQETVKVEALENGADDYVTKPFSLRELLARVQKGDALRSEHDGVGEFLEADSFGQ